MTASRRELGTIALNTETLGHPSKEQQDMDIPQFGKAESEQSLALLETILANGPIGFAFLDREFRYVRLNERLAQINGQSAEAHLGQTVEDIIGPAEWAKRQPIIEQARRGKSTVDVMLPGPFSSAKGEARHLLASYLPVQAEGVVLGVAVLLRDITEQVQAEQALRISEARKATILEVALDCIITIDGEGRIVEFNPAAERTFGYTRLNVLGKVMADLIVPPTLRPRHHAGFAHYLATGEGPILRQRIEITAMRRSGEEFPIELAVIPIQGDGQILFTAYLRDISERKRDETERDRLLREVEASSERQQTFLRDVLASVTGGKLCLCHQKEELPARRPAVSEPVPLSLASGIREMRQQSDEAARTFNFSAERCFDLVTAVSEAAMNAVVHAGGGEGQVFADADTIQVWVQDNGAGIDVAHLPRATLEKGYTTAGSLGHGMKMMLQTVDRISLLTGETGTTVVLEQGRIAPVTVW